MHLHGSLSAHARWQALGVLCLGVLMIVLDTTIVNVALPSIRTDLAFSETSLVWVVNAYMLTFGGLLLLGGRLGDLYGHRRLFLIGIALFTAASLACGLAYTQLILIVARAVQGVGGAVVSAVSLSLMMNLFPEPEERAKAMGVYSFVCAGGGSIGAVAGGLLTNLLSWHWIFLVNLPIGVAVYAACLRLVPRAGSSGSSRRLDLGGAATITVALMLAVYAIVNGNEAGWASSQTLWLLFASAICLIVFLILESSVASPLVPLGMFRRRNLSTASLIGMLWSGAMFAWFFISALYMQLVLGYHALEVGLAFLPANLIMAAFSLGLSARLVVRFGIKPPLVVGLLLATIGLAAFAQAPLHGAFITSILPGMLLLGLGAGMGFNPLLLAAMNDVAPSDSGLASGLVNTSFMMGGALGLAVLASVAAAQTQSLAGPGIGALAALNGGYRLAFAAGAVFAFIAALLSALAMRRELASAVATSGK
jgi:EmrB/QacA subfamily drug resistance transporter